MLGFAALQEGKQPEALLGNSLPLLYKHLQRNHELCQDPPGCCLEANQILSNLMVSLWKKVTPAVQFVNV